MQRMQSFTAPDGTLTYTFKETVNNTTGDAVLLPGLNRAATVSIDPGTGATVEMTVSSLADIKADTATWVPWSTGEVTTLTLQALDARCTAVRLIANTDASTWEIVA